MDYLDFMPHARRDEIVRLLDPIRKRLQSGKKGFVQHRGPYEAVRHLRAEFTDFTGDTVVIGREGELSDRDREAAHAAMRAFMPWRKGPFRVFGIDIDAEWQSFRKWDRLLPHLPDLRGKIIADIGCNNGYYMFRMIPRAPRLVLGFEPYLQHYYCFRALNAMAGQGQLHIEPLGVEHIGLFEHSLDVVFLLGILYHRPDPIGVLRDIRRALRPGGAIIVESQGIPGEEPVALFPSSRYAKVPGTYFVPTASCLHNWLTRAGFGEVTVFDTHPMTRLDQRRTDWMTFESFADFLDPEDQSRTIEGYPAPIRIFLKGVVEGK